MTTPKGPGHPPEVADTDFRAGKTELRVGMITPFIDATIPPCGTGECNLNADAYLVGADDSEQCHCAAHLGPAVMAALSPPPTWPHYRRAPKVGSALWREDHAEFLRDNAPFLY